MRAAAAIVLLACGACRCEAIDWEGYPCDVASGCPTGYSCQDSVCRRGDGGAGSSDAGCPLDVDPARSECEGTTYWLHPDGGASADGTSPASARSTFDGLALAPGDVVVLLPGRYGDIDLRANGSPRCPLLISGGDGGAIIADTLTVYSHDVVVRDLVFNGQGNNDFKAEDTARVTLDRVHFRSAQPAGLFPYNFLFANCTDCSVLDSEFDSEAGLGRALVDSSGFTFRGNVVHMKLGAGLTVDGPRALVAGNEWTGRNPTVYFELAADTVFSRNLLYEITPMYSNHEFLIGGVVISNTFAGIYGAQRPLVIAPTRLENNLVTLATAFADFAVPADGGYNLFDPSVTAPYASALPDGGRVSGTDRIAAVQFETAPSFEPAASSAAIDAADPALPVPPGGGSRADIGAFERGARFAHGRYCLLDAGN